MQVQNLTDSFLLAPPVTASRGAQRLRPGCRSSGWDGTPLSYDDFLARYMHGNRPVVISNVGKGWAAMRT